MWVRAAVVAMLLIGKPAAACPINSPCLKYKRDQQQHKTVQALPLGYTRVVRGMPPAFSVKQLTKFLTSSVWTALYTGGPTRTQVEVIPPPSIRFVEASRVKASDQKPGIRIVLVRRIARRNGITMIEIDGGVFSLAACNGRKATACLTPLDDMLFDDPSATGTGIAKPS